MKGQLTDQPAAELIREISAKGLSGTLRLQHEQAQSAIYFDKGQLLYAASNLRNLRLRVYLGKIPSVTPAEIKRFGSNPNDLKLLAALLVARVITVEQVDALLKALVTDVLRVVLLWGDGSWEFDERSRYAEEFQVSIEVPNLLRESAHRVPPTLITSRFRNPSEKFERAPRVSDMEGMLPEESFILSRLDSPLPLEELVAVSGLREKEAHRIIYGLALSGCVTREYWHNAFRSDIKVGTEQDGAKPLAASKFEKADEDIELDQFLSRVNAATDHYELLDLPLRAEVSEVKEAYYNVARRYHPDRFHLKSGTSLHSNLSTAFARITQAYETLMNSNARASYDSILQRTRDFEAANPVKPDTSTVNDAEFDPADSSEPPDHNFREGVSALQQGRINAAINFLGAAARERPEEARYRAQYGKALAAGERTRRLAEAELQAAIRLDERNPSYRIMLAELYLDLQFPRRAQTELERALALDPNSASAKSLLRKLQKKQKTI